MTDVIEKRPAQLEKLLLILCTIAIVLGNICVLITYFIQANHKYWPNLFILAMTFLDLVIGSVILPLRYISIYNRPMNVSSCLVLLISEGSVLPAILYTLLLMMVIRLFTVHHPSIAIRWTYLTGILISLWSALLVLYITPYLILYHQYQRQELSSDLEATLHCTDYTQSIYRSAWLAYTEIGLSYLLPLSFIIIGLVFLFYHLCQKPTSIIAHQRTTRHVFVLGLVLVVLWLPWIILRSMMLFSNDIRLGRILKITHYILLLKSALFPVLYAATNASFRVSFRIYRHKRIIPTSRF